MAQSTEVIKPLSANEAARLKQLEEIIDADGDAYLRVGMALAEIQDRGLFRREKDPFFTFKKYMKIRFDLSKSRGYQLIDAATVSQEVHNCGLQWKPENEAQARALAQIAKREPEALPHIIEMATETAKDGRITAFVLKKTVNRYKGEEIHKQIRQAADRVKKIDLDKRKRFQLAFDHLMVEVEQARKDKYKNVSAPEVIDVLHTIIEALEKDLGTNGAVAK